MRILFFLIIFIISSFNLFSQVDKSEDFYFSTVEEEISNLNDRARSLDDSNPTEQLQLASDAYSLSLTEELYENQAKALTTMGIAYFHLQEYEQSFEALSKSNLLSQQINYTDGLWDSSYYLGLLHKYLEDYDQAVFYFDNAGTFIPEENDKRNIIIYSELASIYKSENLYEKAIEKANQALILSNNLEEIKSFIENSLLMGEIHFLAGDTRKAIIFFNLILSETTIIGEHENYRASAMSYLGKCYALIGEYNLALTNGQESLLVSVKNNSTVGRMNAYDSLSYIYEVMGDFEQAYKNLQLYYKQKEIFDSANSTGSLNKIKAYYGTFEKEQEIDQQQIQIENQNRMILAGSLMISIFIILILILYLLYRKNSRVATKLSQDLKQEMIISRTDVVTGLPNRKSIEDSIQKAILKWEKNYTDFSLIFLSFETYKKIDKTSGVGTGDKLQKFISKFLKSELKGQDLIAVWKPFLFLMLLPETDRESLNSVIHKMNVKITREKFNMGDETISLVSTVGSFTYSGEGNRSDCIEKCRSELNNN